MLNVGLIEDFPIIHLIVMAGVVPFAQFICEAAFDVPAHTRAK